MKTSLEPHLPAIHLPSATPPARTNEFVAERYRMQAEEVSISLTTSEGDTITIRQSAMTEQINAQSNKNENLRTLYKGMASSGMSIAIHGDLNDQELTDLSKLLNDLSGIAGDFFSGNMTKAVTDSRNITDMGSITSLEATFSRTRLLANYLEVPHPIPSMNDQFNDPLLSEAMKQQGNLALPSGLGNLTAQWQQFLDELTDRQMPPVPPHNDSPAVTSAAMTGKNMFERAKQTMNTHPRLTPLIPSVAELALEQAMHQSDHGHPARQMLMDASGYFNNEFNNWLL